ncbi:MAG: branched-chain amino acid ABC transporter permease [Solirubrobacteraceae bacterium]
MGDPRSILRGRRDGPAAGLHRSQADAVRLWGTPWARFGLVLLIVGWALVPQFVTDDFWLSVLNYAGIAAIAALGLNLLTGYTGQISLGHAVFLGVGAYAAAQIGEGGDIPLVVWLPAAALIGGLVGAAIGPFALRLRGNYLVIVTLGLVFIGEHVFRNLKDVTGGNTGTSVSASPSIGPLDFTDLSLGGQAYSREQGWFWLIWALVAMTALMTKNIVRTRPGRAIQAIRDRDLAAEVVGIEIGRHKIWVFAISSAFAAAAGALYGSYQEYVSPDEWNLFLSIQYIAIIIVGGIGTVFGTVLGALFIGALPSIIEEYSHSIPGVAAEAGDSGISVYSLNQAIFGVLIVAFLLLEPRGLAAIWLRVKAYFRTWPFRY